LTVTITPCLLLTGLYHAGIDYTIDGSLLYPRGLPSCNSKLKTTLTRLTAVSCVTSHAFCIYRCSQGNLPKTVVLHSYFNCRSISGS